MLQGKDDEWLSVECAAEVLGVDVFQVGRWMNSGALAWRRVGGHVRVWRRHVENLMRAQEMEVFDAA